MTVRLITMIIMTSNTDDDNVYYCGEKVDVEIFCFTGHRSKLLLPG
jgi:hypothetical protein